MPLYLKIDEENGNRIGVWKVTESIEELRAKVVLSYEDDKRWNAFRLEYRKKEWLAVRVLVKELLGKDHAVFYRNSGAPFFEDEKMHIGITHTNGYAGVSIAPFSTALDMEKASPKIECVYRRFVSDAEMAFIPGSERIDYFNVIWSTKETLFKLINKQAVVFREHLMIKPFVLSESGEITAEVKIEDLNFDVWMNYRILPDFTLVYYVKSIKK